MKTLSQILESGEAFELSETKYNAVSCNPEHIKKDGGAVIYKIYKISDDNRTAHGYNTNAWGDVKSYVLDTRDIAPYNT